MNRYIYILGRLGVIKPFISRLTFNNGGSSSLDSTPEHHAMPQTPASAWNEWGREYRRTTCSVREGGGVRLRRVPTALWSSD